MTLGCDGGGGGGEDAVEGVVWLFVCAREAEVLLPGRKERARKQSNNGGRRDTGISEAEWEKKEGVADLRINGERREERWEIVCRVVE